MHRAVALALAEAVDPALDLARPVLERRVAGRLPPEYQAEIVASWCPDTYFEVLRCLDGGAPNRVHLSLAALARSGRLGAIVTTNFDRVTEAAFDRLGVPLEVCSGAADFERLAAHPDRIGRGPCLLLKIHGSVEDPATLVDTLAQRKRGFAPAVVDSLRRLLVHAHWLFLGWSGADLEAEADYLGLVAERDVAPGFTWLLRPGEAPLPAVQRTVDAYGGRARIVHGELPGVLDPLVADLDVPEPVPGEAPPSIDDHVRRWASALGRTRATLVMADLLGAAGRPDVALDALERADALVPDSAERSGEKSDLAGALAAQYRARGDFARSLSTAPRARALAEAREDRAAVGRSMNAEALAHEALGEYDLARDLFHASLAIREAIGDRRGRLASLVGLSVLERRRGRYAEAIAANREILSIRVELGDELGRAWAIWALADLHGARSEYDAAESLFGQALAIFARLGASAGESRVLASLATLLRRRGRPVDAIPLYERSLELKKALGDDRGRAGVLLGLAAACRQSDRLELARNRAEDAQRLFESIGDRHGSAMAWGEVASVRLALGDLDAAREAFERSLELKARLGDQAGRGISLRGLAAVLAARGEPGAARRSLVEAHGIAVRIGDRLGEGETSHLLARHFAGAGQPTRARAWARRAIASLEPLGVPLPAGMDDLLRVEGEWAA